MNNETFQIKRCPFCGGKAMVMHYEKIKSEKPRFWVKCRECWCATPSFSYSEEEAATVWNRRAGE